MAGAKNKGVLLRGVKGLPIQVPGEILKWQADLGPTATLVWINLVAFSQLGQAFRINSLARQMGLPKREVSQALALLADRGWINDEGLEIRLTVQAEAESLDPVQEEVAAAAEPLVNGESDAYEWLVSYISARITVPTPEEQRKLLYWMQSKSLSHEVIAVAIEEMCASAAHPSFPYLEGILRNWHGVGIRTYNDLLENPYLAKVLAPIAGGKDVNSAEKRWREVFPDEFD